MVHIDFSYFKYEYMTLINFDHTIDFFIHMTIIKKNFIKFRIKNTERKKN